MTSSSAKAEIRLTFESLNRHLPSKAKSEFKKTLRKELAETYALPSIPSLLVAGVGLRRRLEGLRALLASSAVDASDVPWTAATLWALLRAELRRGAPGDPRRLPNAQALAALLAAAGLPATSFVGALVDEGAAEWELGPAGVFAVQPGAWVEVIKAHSVVGLRVLIRLIHELAAEPKLRKEHGLGVLKAVLGEWESWEKLLNSDSDFADVLNIRSLLIRLIAKLALISTTFLIYHPSASEMSSSGAAEFPKFPNLLRFYADSLKLQGPGDVDLHPFKNECLGLLGLFACLPSGSPHLATLQSALDEFAAAHLPLRSSEIKGGAGSRAHGLYMSSLDALVLALRISAAPLVLAQLSAVLCRESRHVAEAHLSNALAAFCRSQSPQSIGRLVETPLDIFLPTQPGSVPDQLRRNALDKVALPMLVGMTADSLGLFFLAHIQRIMTVIESPLEKAEESNVSSKLGCWKLIEVAYSRLSQSFLKVNLSNAFNTGRADKAPLVKILSRIGRDVRSESMSGYGETLTELQFQLRCAAQNGLAAVISATQTEPKFFSGIVLHRSSWDQIVPSHRPFTFAYNSEYHTTSNYQSLMQTTADQSGQNKKRNLRFLASQTLGSTSLAPPATVHNQHDFHSLPGSESLSQGSQDELNSPESKPALDETKEEEAAAEGGGRSWEEDDVSRQPSFLPLLMLMRRLLAKETVAGDAPEWLRTMQEALANEFTRVEVRQFIAKLVVSLCKELSSLSAELESGLLSLFLSAGNGDAGKLHSFRAEILVCVLTWRRKGSLHRSEAEKRLSRQVVDFLVYATAQAADAPTVTRNIKLLHHSVSLWGQSVICYADEPSPLVALLDLECRAESTSTERRVALEMAGVFFDAGVELTPHAHPQRPRLHRNIVSGLRSRGVKAAKTASEVIGLALSHLYARKDDANEVAELVAEVVAALRGSAREPGRFLPTALALCASAPSSLGIADEVAGEVLSLLSRVSGELGRDAVRLLSLCGRELGRVCRELCGPLRGRFAELLSTSEGSWISGGLDFLTAALRRLEGADEERLLDALAGTFAPILTHKVTATSAIMPRAKLLDMAILLYDQHRTSDPRIEQMSKSILLQSLSDANLNIRHTALQFWGSGARLGAGSCERGLGLISECHGGGSESAFLGCASYLLLALTADAPDFHRPLHATPLRHCDYEPLPIAVHWRSRNAGLETPAFAASQGLAATQADHQRAFTPTQASQGSLDFVSGSYVGAASDTFGDSSLDSSLSFAISTQRRANAFNQTDGGATDPERDEQMSTGLQFLKRVRRDQGNNRALFARITERKKRAEEESVKERSESRGQKVRILRQYKTGDFPDVQIPHSDLIRALQALAKLDTLTGSVLVEELLRGVLRSCEDEQTLADALSRFFANSGGNGPVFSSLLLAGLSTPSVVAAAASAEVAAAAEAASEEPLGLIFLAAQLHQLKDRSGEPRAKSRRQDGDDAMGLAERGIWLASARLYRSLGDGDALRAVLRDALAAGPELRGALALETGGELGEAVKGFNAALAKANLSLDAAPDALVPLLDQELALTEHLRNQCLDKLGKWDRLATVVAQDLHLQDASQESMETDGASLETAQSPFRSGKESQLRFYVRAITKRYLDSPNEVNVEPLNQLRGWLKTKEWREKLAESNASELLVLALLDGRLVDGLHQAQTSIENFLAYWGSLSVGRREARWDAVQSLLPIMHLKQTIQVANQRESEAWDLGTSRARVESLFGASLLSPAESPEAWDDLTSSRLLLLSRLGSDALSSGGASGEEVATAFADVRVRLHLRHADAAAAQRNFRRALAKLETAAKLMGSRRLGGPVEAEFRLTNARLSLAQSRASPPSADNVARLASALHILLASNEAKEAELRGECWQFLAHNVAGVDDSEISKEQLAEVADLLSQKGAISSRETLIPALRSQALKTLSAAVKDSSDPNAIPLIDFCDSLSQQEGLEAGPYSAALIAELCRELQRSPRLELCQRLPRLISVLQSSPKLCHTFETESAGIEPWVWVGWVSQIVSLLDSPTLGATFAPIVAKLAEKYPQAVIYPLKLSMEQFKFDGKEGKVTQAALLKIMATESLAAIQDTVDSFIAALNLLHQGNAALKDGVEEATLGGRDRAKLRALLRDVFFRRDESSEALAYPIPLGDYWTRFSKAWAHKFAKLMDLKDSEQAKALSLLVEEVKNAERKNMRSSEQLRDFSPWLCDTDFGRLGLEIPGQYGHRRPEPTAHVRIAAFEPRLRVMASLRRPKVLTVRGDDGREFRYLVKAGEDLRQDARIQDLFGLANGILAADAECRRRQLQLKTYSVVPVTSRVGLIQFLPGVTDLKGFIAKQKTSLEKKTNPALKLSDIGTSSNVAKDYIASYARSSTTVKAAFRQAQNCYRPNLLQLSLQGMCRSLRDYSLVRDHFVSTHAVVCACHYILGIGDRHQSNFMVEESSGGVVGIDFGHAFGSATQFLPIPELMPFRLTRQFTEVMSPLGPSGSFGATLSETLRSLRAAAPQLLASMDIFVREPSLDWLTNARKQEAAGFSGGDSWFPAEKVGLAREKLEGRNPALVTRDELRTSRACRHRGLDVLSAALLGVDAKADLKAALARPRGFPQLTLTPEQQADCLIRRRLRTI